MSIDFSHGKKTKGPENLNHWWESSKDAVGKDLTDYCRALELSQRPQRFKNYAFHMVTTGHAPISYGLAMPSEGETGAEFTYAGSDLYNTEFTPPSENICEIAADTFTNKIWCQRPFLQWLPPNDENYKLRRSCKEATFWTDQIFEDLNVWDLIQAAGKDSGIVGTGWIFGDAIVSQNKIKLERVDDDCILIDPTAGENPRSWQMRWFRDRRELIQQYATGPREKEITEAILKAPGCRLGFFPMPIGYQDTIALVGGWYCARGDEPGRYAIAVEGCALEDEIYEDEKPPLVKQVWQRIPGSVRGKGTTETILPIQRELDRTADNIAEQERVCAWNRAQSRVGNNIDVDTLSGNNLIEYTIEPVKFEQGIAPPPQLYQNKKDLRNSGLFSVGITEAQVQGASSPGITAAVAMQSEMQISDVRHRSVSLQQERSVEELGQLVIRLAKKAKPTVEFEGRNINFSEVEKAVKGGKCRAFPLSGLPQSIPGRIQEIENQYKNGQLDKAQYQRLKGLPVTSNSNDEQTAPLDLIYYQLDEMIETGKFQIVLPFQDLLTAKDKAVRRYQLEVRRKLPRDRLQLLAMYIAQIVERSNEQGPTNMPSAQPQPAIPPTQAPAAQGV
jgi:hypothetical protein